MSLQKLAETLNDLDVTEVTESMNKIEPKAIIHSVLLIIGSVLSSMEDWLSLDITFIIQLGTLIYLIFLGRYILLKIKGQKLENKKLRNNK